MTSRPPNLHPPNRPWGWLATAWPAIAKTDSESLRRRIIAVRAGHLAMALMVVISVVSSILADHGDFKPSRIIILGVVSLGYIVWNLVGTQGIIGLVLWESNSPPPLETRVPRFGALPYFVAQIALGGMVYLSADHGHIPNLVWLVLLPPVAYAVFLLEWRGISLVSLIMIGILVANAYRWQGFVSAILAAVAFCFAVLFTLVFSLLAVHSEKSRNEVQRLATELEAANRQLREYAVQAEELAVTRERNRIAREIHDSLGHHLTVVNMQLEAARAVETNDPAHAREAIAKAQAFTQQGLKDIRNSLATLRASPLDNQSLTGALKELVASSNQTGLPTEFVLAGVPRPLSSMVELSLYRAVQEGLTNVRKHAQAKLVRVNLDFEHPHRTVLSVEDDGLGTNLEANRGGFGLLGLRERAHLIGGTLLLQSHPGVGFKLKLEVPE